MQARIRQCPFCGSLSLSMVRTRDHASCWVECRTCGTLGPIVHLDPLTMRKARKKAVLLWNERVVPKSRAIDLRPEIKRD